MSASRARGPARRGGRQIGQKARRARRTYTLSCVQAKSERGPKDRIGVADTFTSVHAKSQCSEERR